MQTKEVIKHQYSAALEMMRQVVEKCPETLWASPEYSNPTWHVVFHALFYTHLYLQPAEVDFEPWELHREQYRSLRAAGQARDESRPYTRQEMLDYVTFCKYQVEEIVERLDLEGSSGFSWLPFNKLEAQFYNLRHLQQHIGELCERLGAKGEIEVDWIGKVDND